MKTKILIGLIIVLILCTIFATLKFIVPNINSSKELKLTYKLNAGIPFKWEYEIEDKTVVEFVKSYVSKDENKDRIVGAPVYTNYIFKGLKEGETTITFKLVNFTDKTVSDTQKHRVKVDKNNNISLIKTDK